MQRRRKSLKREDTIAIAKTYLIEGLLLHQPENALLADDCNRIENGVETGGSGAEIRRLLAGDDYLLNESIENERWVVEGEFADVWYELKLRGVDQRILVVTRFEIIDGHIKRIDLLVDAGALQSQFVEDLDEQRTDQ